MKSARNRNRTPGVVFGLALVLLAGCAGTLLSGEETPGQRFDRGMKEFAAKCAKAKLKPNDTACDILKLKPADPLATEEGRFAHSIKIPNPLPENSGYKPGMTSQEYFDHLCKTEAGEFIYKTVEHVEGLYLLRLDKPEGSATEHLYALEAPYGRGVGGAHPEEYFVQPALGKYQYLEVPIAIPKFGSDAPKKLKRFYRDEKAHPDKQYQTAMNGQFKMVPYIVAEREVATPKSRYGFTWRGIARSHDRELGIGGGEIIVLDLEANEVLAVRRGFVLGVFEPKRTPGFSWALGQVCSGAIAKPEHVFINEVLIPIAKTAVQEN